MLHKIKSFFFSPKIKNTYIRVKHMGENISIFYKNKSLTPNVDYTILGKDAKSVSKVKTFQEIDRDHLEVFQVVLRYKNKKADFRPWGYKKFKIE